MARKQSRWRLERSGETGLSVEKPELTDVVDNVDLDEKGLNSSVY